MPPRLKHKSEVDLFPQRFEYDLALAKVYRAKLSSHAALKYHHLVDHAKRRRVQAREAVESLFRGTPPRFKLFETERQSEAVQSMLQYLRELGVGSEAYSRKPVALMAVLNWTAPSTISNGSLAVQEALLGSTLNAVGFDSLGFVSHPFGSGRKDFCGRRKA